MTRAAPGGRREGGEIDREGGYPSRVTRRQALALFALLGACGGSPYRMTSAGGVGREGEIAPRRGEASGGAPEPDPGEPPPDEASVEGEAEVDGEDAGEDAGGGRRRRRRRRRRGD
jgi:hypothetical protein